MRCWNLNKTALAKFNYSVIKKHVILFSQKYFLQVNPNGTFIQLEFFKLRKIKLFKNKIPLFIHFFMSEANAAKNEPLTKSNYLRKTRVEVFFKFLFSSFVYTSGYSFYGFSSLLVWSAFFSQRNIPDTIFDLYSDLEIVLFAWNSPPNEGWDVPLGE